MSAFWVSFCDVGEEHRYFLSFPWIVSGILAEIYHENTEKQNIRYKTHDTEISDSVKELFHEAVE